MKKTLAVLSVVWLAGCEYNVRQEPAPRPYEPPTYEPAPVPMPSSSSQPTLPPATSGTTDGDASAAPSYTCEGFAVECSDLDLDLVACGDQHGCTVSLNDGSCFGAPTPCSWLVTEAACGNQLGCAWTAPPPR